jgi:hypothetical protein
MLQSLLVDLELWLTETQATIATEIKLTSVQVVKEQIRASQVSQTKPHTLEIGSYFFLLAVVVIFPILESNSYSNTVLVKFKFTSKPLPVCRENGHRM